MADFVFNLSENTVADRLQLVRSQAHNQQLTPILQALIENSNLRHNDRNTLLDQVTLLQSDQQTDCNSLILRLYETLDRAQFPTYNTNSWTVYYQNYVNHQVAVFDDYASRRQALMNLALRNQQPFGAHTGVRPNLPVKEPYEITEEKIIWPLCPATNRFLDNNPLENELPVNATLMEKFLITDTSTKVILLYHSLYKILSNISKYGFSRVTVKEMFQYVARKY